MATVRVTREMAERAVREIDWARQDALTDADIARHVGSDPDAPPLLTDAETAAALVRTVRLRLGLSQAEFARRFRVPLGTLRDWEQQRRQPDATALAYLRVIAREPEIVARVLAA
ncbi:MAG: helix-turn-helix domain-containing protein [Rhodospirillales bacterium]|nr:helix-turn-helix domain-containing protein [Rhodospirillales bacterium]